jgi:mitochondrial fission protein ELM1
MLFSTVVKISFVITLNGHAYFQVLTTGALHQIDYASLRKAASAWHDEFAALPKPLVVVNIGWPRSNCRYGADLAKQLTDSLLNVLATCGSVRITLSYKTPAKVSYTFFFFYPEL